MHGAVGFLIHIKLQIYQGIFQRNFFVNRLRLDRIMVMAHPVVHQSLLSTTLKCFAIVTSTYGTCQLEHVIQKHERVTSCSNLQARTTLTVCYHCQ